MGVQVCGKGVSVEGEGWISACAPRTVLPLPKKPVSTVTGMRSFFAMPLLLMVALVVVVVVVVVAVAVVVAVDALDVLVWWW